MILQTFYSQAFSPLKKGQKPDYKKVKQIINSKTLTEKAIFLFFLRIENLIYFVIEPDLSNFKEKNTV